MKFQVSDKNKLGSYLITGVVLDMVLMHTPLGYSFLTRKTTKVESQRLFGTSKAVSSFDLGNFTSNFPVPCVCCSVGIFTLRVTRFIEEVTSLILRISFRFCCIIKIIHGACQSIQLVKSFSTEG